MTRNDTLGVLRSIAAAARTEQLTFLAAAIAYYAFVSLLPLTLVGLAVASAVGGETLAAQVIELVDRYLTPEAVGIFERSITDPEGRGGATVAGVALLGWSGLRLFRGLDVAFSEIYGGAELKSLPAQLRDALVVLVAIAGALALTAAVATYLPLADVPQAGFVGTLAVAVVLPVVFFPLYYVFPSKPVTVREAIPGAIFAGGGWTVLAAGFGVYASRAASFQLYGVIGGVLLVLTFFYLGGLVVLLGALLNAVLADRVGDRQLQQGALPDFGQRMSDAEAPDDAGEDAGNDAPEDVDSDPSQADDVASDDGVATVDPRVDPAELEALRTELRDLEDNVDERTVHREDLESDLKEYVRWRVRRGHASGWGPYLVLLYGTIMTLGAFYYLEGGWAVAAMVVIWLSTLGLYTLMVLVGVTVSVTGLPGKLLEKLRDLR